MDFSDILDSLSSDATDFYKAYTGAAANNADDKKKQQTNSLAKYAPIALGVAGVVVLVLLLGKGK